MAAHYLVTGPADVPVPLATVKTWLRIDAGDSTDDSLITGLIKGCADHAERVTSRCFMQSDYRWQGDNWPLDGGGVSGGGLSGSFFSSSKPYFTVDDQGYLVLERGPLVQVKTVKYYPAGGGIQQTLAASEYQVEVRGTTNRGRVRFNGTLPGLADRPDAVQIDYTSGYGAAGANAVAQQVAVPDAFNTWLQIMIATVYENRQGFLTGMNMTNLMTQFDSFLNVLKLY